MCVCCCPACAVEVSWLHSVLLRDFLQRVRSLASCRFAVCRAGRSVSTPRSFWDQEQATFCASMSDQDFLDIVALVGAGFSASSADGVVPQQALVAAPIAADIADSTDVVATSSPCVAGGPPEPTGDEVLDILAVMAGDGARPQRRRHEQRSWQHAQLARSGKALKRSFVDAESARSVAAAAQQTSAALATLAGQACPNQLARRVMTPEMLAVTKAALACAPSRKVSAAGSHALASMQLAHCINEVQQRCLRHMFLVDGLASAQACVLPAWVGQLGSVRNRMHVFCWQWDETEQKIRAALPGRFLAARMHKGQVSTQTMMATASMHVHANGDAGRLSVVEPFFVKGLVLESQKANHILEALLRRLPVPIDHPERFEVFTQHCGAFILAWAMDRASVNFVISQYIFDQIVKMPPNVLGHLEPCAAHGLHLVKERAPYGKNMASAANSLSKLLRTPSFAGVLQDALARLVERELIVKHKPRPKIFCERAERFFNAVFGSSDESDAYLLRRDREGDLHDSQLAGDIKELVAVVDIGSTEIVHWCHSPCSAGSGQEVAPCCVSREESVERVLLPIINFVFGSCWEVAALSRWTHVSKLLKRALIGCMCYNLLPRALSEVKCFWGFPETESIAAALKRMLQADNQDWSVRAKRKLLRICKAFCSPTAQQELGLSIATHLVVDRSLYAILGHDGQRASMADLCHLERSPLLHSADCLCKMLRNWGADAALWDILAVSGADFSSPPLMVAARQQILRLLSGFHDYFFARMSKPPYSLTPLFDTALPQASREEVVARFFEESVPCLPPFCVRLRTLCPTPAAMLTMGAEVVHAWAASCACAIDACERSHAQFRRQVASPGPAKSAVAAANRALCARAHAAHVAKGGESMPAGGKKLEKVLSIARGGDEGEPVRKKRSMHSGSAFIRFLNNKMKAYKQLHSPHESLTQEQQDRVRGSARQEWSTMQAIGSEEVAAWRLATRTAKIRDVLLDNRVDTSADPSGQFVGLWGASQHKELLLDPSVLVQGGVGQPCSSASAWVDPSVYVRADVEQRCGNRGRGPPMGCFAQKKNVCRKHHVHSATELEGLGRITHLLSKWVDSLGKDRARSCNELIWLSCAPKASPNGGAASSSEDDAGLLVLLVDVVYKPKAQLFAKCVLDKSPTMCSSFVLPDCPFVAKLSVGSPLMRGFGESVQLISSDDLALEMSRRAPDWSLTEMQWQMEACNRDLLSMRVVGRGSVFEVVTARRQECCGVLWPKELDMGDPLDLSKSSGQGAIDALAAAFADTGGSDGEGQGEESVSEMSSAAASLQHELCAGGLWGDLELPEDGAGGVGEGVAADPAQRDLEEALAEAANDEAPEGPSVEEAVRASSISEGGHVSCALEPWRSRASLGRITTWPEHQPHEKRSVSMRCFLHPRCSAARARSKVSDELLLTWLYSGVVPEPGADKQQKDALRDQHISRFKQMMSQQPPPP